MSRNSKFYMATLALGVVTFTACGDSAPETGPELRPVRYQVVSVGGGESSRALVGVARAGTEADLSFRVRGTVEQVNVSLGEKVEGP